MDLGNIFGGLTVNPMASLPVAIVLFALIFGGLILYLRQSRKWIFYWRDSIGALVQNYEGGAWSNPKPDRLRETFEDGKMVWESQRWGDKNIEATYLKKLVRVIPTSRGHRKEVFLMRQRPGEWLAHGYETDKDGKVIVHPIMEDGMKIALANTIIRVAKRNEEQSWWDKNQGLVVMGFCFIMLLITTVIVTQFIGAQLNQTAQILAASTGELARTNQNLYYLLNSTGRIPTTPAPPPG
jgi:hypothetical protein